MRDSDHQLVFIGGLHRSGTSALYRALDKHPEISCLSNTGVPQDEGQHLQAVYPTARELGGPGRFGFYSKARIVEDSPLVTDENRRRLLAAWSPYWDLRKLFLIEKSPPNTIRSRFLQALFPNSSFIFLIRHPIPTTLSTMKWSHVSLTASIEHWLVCHNFLLEDLPFIKRYVLFRYEDFVSNPTAHTTRISDLLGASNDFDVSTIRAGVNEAYFEQWRRLKLRSQNRQRVAGLVNRLLFGESIGMIEQWKEIADIETRYEGAINRFGYSLFDDSPRPGQQIVYSRMDGFLQ